MSVLVEDDEVIWAVKLPYDWVHGAKWFVRLEII